MPIPITGTLYRALNIPYPFPGYTPAGVPECYDHVLDGGYVYRMALFRGTGNVHLIRFSYAGVMTDMGIVMTGRADYSSACFCGSDPGKAYAFFFDPSQSTGTYGEINLATGVYTYINTFSGVATLQRIRKDPVTGKYYWFGLWEAGEFHPLTSITGPGKLSAGICMDAAFSADEICMLKLGTGSANAPCLVERTKRNQGGWAEFLCSSRDTSTPNLGTSPVAGYAGVRCKFWGAARLGDYYYFGNDGGCWQLNPDGSLQYMTGIAGIPSSGSCFSIDSTNQLLATTAGRDTRLYS